MNITHKNSLKSDIILHHYPQSPVAEKVRVVLGIKNLEWRSVNIPRLPPKPNLVELTGGYRLTPVMQIGADMYCDSPCIIRAIDQLYPTARFIGDAYKGLVWGMGRWSDSILFKSSIAVVLGDAGLDLPDDFANDRIPLYFGNTTTIHDLIRDLTHNRMQLASQLHWVENQLTYGNPYLNGAYPGLMDDLCYYPVWFLRGRLSDAETYLNEFPKIVDWENRIQKIGHGEYTDMQSLSALDVARKASPIKTKSDLMSLKKLGLNTGDPVSLYSESPEAHVATGTLGHIDENTISIHRQSERCGLVAVHFPLFSYRLIKHKKSKI